MFITFPNNLIIGVKLQLHLLVVNNDPHIINIAYVVSHHDP